MEEKSILGTIKKLLGIEETDTSFDEDIILYINSVFMTLNQVGVGLQGFLITDSSSKWKDFINDIEYYSAIPTYVYLKVRLLFDPPQMGYLVSAIKDQITEIEWRLNIQVEGGQKDDDK